MGRQSSDIAFEKSSLLAKVLGDTDEKVLDSNVKYFKALYKEDKGKAIEEYLAFVEKLQSESFPVKTHLRNIGTWMDDSGASFMDSRKKYAGLLSICYGEKSKELELELGLFAKDCYLACEYDCCASVFEWKKTIRALDVLEAYYLFDAYHKQEKYSEACRLGIEEEQRIIEGGDQNQVATFCLNLIESCYCAGRNSDIVPVIESLRSIHQSIEFLYGFIDDNCDSYGYYTSYIYSGYLCSNSIIDLKNSAFKCFSKSDFIKGAFYSSSLKKLKDYIVNWMAKNRSCLNEDNERYKLKLLSDDFSVLAKIAYEQMQVCKKKKESIDYELLDICFGFIRDSQLVEFVSLQPVILTYFVQLDRCPIICSDPFEFYKNITNFYFTVSDTKLNSSWIDLSIRLGDFTYRYNSELSQKLGQSKKMMLDLAVKYYSNAVSWNDKLNTYSDSEMRVFLRSKRKASSELYDINDRINRKKKAEKHDKTLLRMIGFSYLIIALLLAVFTITNNVYSWYPNLTIGLIAGIAILIINCVLNWTKPIFKTITDGVLLLSTIIVRLFLVNFPAIVFMASCVSLLVCFSGNLFSSRLKEIYKNNVFDKVNAVLAVLSVCVLLVLGFSFSWYIWQWIIGGVFAILLIVSQIVLKYDGYEYGAEIILGASLLLNFILLAIFKDNYHQIFELLSVAIGVCAIIEIIIGFADSEEVPLYCGISFLMLNLFSLIPWTFITINSNQAVLSVLLGFRWSIGEWILGISFGIAIVFLPIIVRHDIDDDYCAILSAVVLIVSLIANFVLYFIFKDRYYLIFQFISIAIEIGSVVSIILGIKESDSFLVILGIIIGLVNLLSIIVWFRIMKSGSPDAIIVSRAVQAVRASSGQAESTQGISYHVVSDQKDVHQWWKWPLGIIGALAILAISLIPNGCFFSVVLFFVDIFLLEKYGYPGAFDIFFKCFTFGMALSGIPGLFHEQSKKWTKIIGLLITVACVIIIFHFDSFMTYMVDI